MAEEERSHKCVLCSCTLESKESLQEHFRKHANKEIDFHGRPLKAKESKRIYKKSTPNNEKEEIGIISCDVCGQEFSQNSRAIQHKFKKHPDVLVKYICPYCGKQFTLKMMYDNHLNEHDSDVRVKSSFFCEECGVEFYFKEAKNYHCKSSHTGMFVPSTPLPPPSKKIKLSNNGSLQSAYYCHLCGCEYVQKFNLLRHLKKTHSEVERTAVPEGLIRCNRCEALFYSITAYEVHNTYHKPDDLYVTSEQHRVQTVSTVDQDFDVTRVLPLAEKYIPSYKSKSKKKRHHDSAIGEDKNEKNKIEEDLSPPSSPDSPSISSDSDDGVTSSQSVGEIN